MAEKPVRILHVMEATGGGTAKALYLQLTNTDAARFELEVAIPRPEKLASQRVLELADVDYADKLKDAGLRVHFLDMVGGRIALAANLMAARQLRQVLKRGSFEILHLHSAIAGFVGRAAAITGPPIKIVYSPEGFAFDEHVPNPERQMYLIAERLLGVRTDALVACSTTERNLAIQSHVAARSRTHLIYNPLDTASYRSESIDCGEIRAELGLARGAPVIVTVARMVPQKGLSHLVQAALRVARHSPAVKFVVVGDGRLRPELESQIATLGLDAHFVLTGNRKDYLEIMAAADIFVLPSLWEGLPYAPVEAMLLGKPVISTTISGMIDVLGSGDGGILVAPGDSDALAEAVILLLEDEDLRRRLGRGGEARMRNLFAIERSMESMMSLYDSLVAR